MPLQAASVPLRCALADDDGEVTLEEWQTFIDNTYQAKGPKKAPKWLRALLHTLRTYIKAQASTVAEPAEEQNDEVEYEVMRQECEEVFKVVAGPDETLTKEELVTAHGGLHCTNQTPTTLATAVTCLTQKYVVRRLCVV